MKDPTFIYRRYEYNKERKENSLIQTTNII